MGRFSPRLLRPTRAPDNSDFTISIGSVQCPVYNCDQSGLWTAYTGASPYVKDGLLFYNKHAHYQTGNTPLALVWKDENCSQYVIDTDSIGQILRQQQPGLLSGNLLRFAIGDGGLNLVDGKLEKADLHYLGKVHQARAFADSYSKVIFQHMARHSPLKIDDLVASVCSSSEDQQSKPCDIEMSS